MKTATKNIPYYVTINPKGFDAFMCDNKKQIFAVFDGIGTSAGARKAVDKCLEIAGIYTAGNENWQTLRMVLQRCVNTVNALNDTQAGCTATIASIDDNGHLHYAHVGDSRLYVYNNGRVKQVTSDEGVGNLLLNSVGPSHVGVTQAGTVYANWQKFMLCTDGVTGDWEPQLLSDEDIEKALVFTPQAAIDRLMQLSKKTDDKTIVIVGK